MNPATASPRLRKADMSPVAIVVFPTPDWVPATTTLGTMLVIVPAVTPASESVNSRFEAELMDAVIMNGSDESGDWVCGCDGRVWPVLRWPCS